MALLLKAHVRDVRAAIVRENAEGIVAATPVEKSTRGRRNREDAPFVRLGIIGAADDAKHRFDRIAGKFEAFDEVTVRRVRRDPETGNWVTRSEQVGNWDLF